MSDNDVQLKVQGGNPEGTLAWVQFATKGQFSSVQWKVQGGTKGLTQ